MEKILVTGFSPFGGEVINPALEAIKKLPTHILGVQIIVCELPTAFEESARMLYEQIDKLQPDAVLAIGQAGGRAAITLERVAINIDDAPIPDNLGAQPIDEVIREDGSSAYFSSLPIKRIVQRIQAEGIPAKVSNTAGTYVCNHLMYQLLYYLNSNNLTTKGGFMHIPYLPEQVVNRPQTSSMALQTIVQAMEVAISVIIEYAEETDIKVIGGADQ